MLRQRIPNPEMALHPQISQLGALRDELRDTRKIGGPLRLGVTLGVPPQHSNLARFQRVDEERGMGRDQQLGVFGCRPAFLGQAVQQPGGRKFSGSSIPMNGGGFES